MSYSTGPINVKSAQYSYEKAVTVEDVVGEANKISKKAQRQIKQQRLKFGDVAGAELLMADLKKQHPQFCESYPIVFRYICQMQEYDPKALRQWLDIIKKKPWSNPQESITAQAKYVGILYRVTCQKKGKRYNQTEITNIEKNVEMMLTKEYEQFKNYANEIEAEVDANEKIHGDRNIEEMIKFAKLSGAERLACAEILRVESDIATNDLIDVDKAVNELAGDIETTDEFGADDLLG